MATQWGFASHNGILTTGSLAGAPGPDQQFGELPPQFQAGAVNAVLFQVDAVTTLVSTPTSGVWALDLGAKLCTSVSQKWIRPEIKCLAQGLSMAGESIFAGGGKDGTATLWQTTFTTVLFDPTIEWNQIDFGGLVVSNINSMCVSNGHIFLACDNGIFWSPIPPSGGFWNFKNAIFKDGGDVPRWSSVVPTKVPMSDAEIIAGAWWNNPNEQNLPALFRGSIRNDNLVINKDFFQPSGANFRVLLASSQPAGNQVALIGGAGFAEMGGIEAVWKRDSDIDPWISAGLVITNMPGHNINEPDICGFLSDWTGAITIDDNNPKLVAIGWADSYFISKDGAETWLRIATKGDNISPNIHGIEIASEGNFFLATDRGFYSTTDNGTTHSSVANQNLPNLQFESGDLDSSNPGLAVSTWTDASSVYCNLHDGEQLWRPINDWVADTPVTSRSLAFVRNGQLVDAKDTILSGRIDPFDRPPGWNLEQKSIPTDPSGIAPGFALNAHWEAVDVPVSMSQNSDRAVIVAVGFSGSEVFGVFNGPDSNAHGSTLTISMLFDLSEATPPATGNISIIASADGQTVVFGTSDGALVRAAPKIPGKPRVSGVAWTAGTWVLTTILPGPGPPITDVSARLNDSVYAITSIDPQILRVDGNALTALPSPFPVISSILSIPSENGMVVITLPDPNPGTVFQSLDKGVTWTDISRGLPASPHPVAIRHAPESGGGSLLYLFTSGWSLWTTFIHPVRLDSVRQVMLSGRMGIKFNGDNSDNPFPSQTATLNNANSVAELKALGENNKVKVYLTLRLELNGVDNSVKVTYGVFLNNFISTNHGSADGEMIILAPGSSQYIDIYVQGTNDSSDNANCNFLVSN